MAGIGEGRGCGVARFGGVAGPVAFTGAWLVGAAGRPGYRPTTDTISRLAEAGVDRRWVMTAGFVTFGLGVGAYSGVLRRAVPGPAWATAAATAASTLAVAALPVGVSPRGDTLHAAAAAAGYVALAATPALAGRSLRAERVTGRSPLAAASSAASGLCAVALVASLTGPHRGAFQRAGLGAGHLWLAAGALAGALASPPCGRHREAPASGGGFRAL